MHTYLCIFLSLFAHSGTACSLKLVSSQYWWHLCLFTQDSGEFPHKRWWHFCWQVSGIGSPVSGSCYWETPAQVGGRWVWLSSMPVQSQGHASGRLQLRWVGGGCGCQVCQSRVRVMLVGYSSSGGWEVQSRVRVMLAALMVCRVV